MKTIIAATLCGILLLGTVLCGHATQIPYPLRASETVVSDGSGMPTVSTNASGGTTTVTPASNSTLFGSFQTLGNALTSGTNWVLTTGGGRSTAGNKNLAFAAVGYNFNQNVGIVVGYDVLFGKGKPSFNSLKGGVTLQTQVHPLAFIGTQWADNLSGQLFAAYLIATPKAGNGLGSIATAGIAFDLVNFANFNFGANLQYENRSGQSYWDGNYILGGLQLARKF